MSRGEFSKAWARSRPLPWKPRGERSTNSVVVVWHLLSTFLKSNIDRRPSKLLFFQSYEWQKVGRWVQRVAISRAFPRLGRRAIYHICICKCSYSPTCTTLGAVPEVNELVEQILSLCGGPSGSDEVSLELLRYLCMHSYACVHSKGQEIYTFNTTSSTPWICHWGSVCVTVPTDRYGHCVV